MATDTAPGWTTRDVQSLRLAIRVFKATYRHAQSGAVVTQIGTFRLGRSVIGAAIEVQDNAAPHAALYVLTVAANAPLIQQLLPVGADNALPPESWANAPVVLDALKAIDPKHQVHGVHLSTQAEKVPLDALGWL